MQIIHNILFARIICRSGEAKKCVVRVERICARTQQLARPPSSVRVQYTRTHAGTRTHVATQRRVVINFNKTLGVRRERGRGETVGGAVGEAELERERPGKEREYVRHDSYTFITNAYEHVRLYVSAL